MYWNTLKKLVVENRIVIDRKKGSTHPMFKEAIYPLDYGYLENTSAMDGAGIDIFVGSLNSNEIQGIICTLDELKKDAEIKIMYNCTENEILIGLEFLNKGKMKGIFVRNKRNPTIAST